MIDLDELERLEKAATPGPWRTGPINYANIYAQDGDLILLAIKDRPRTVEDVQILITVRNAFPHLLTIARAADVLANWFAWSAVTTDCDEARVYLQGLIDRLRAALDLRAAAAPGLPCDGSSGGEEQAATRTEQNGSAPSQESL
jgi:hypothetical protein